MTKPYSDRAMEHEDQEREFFFPNHNPPATVKAKTRAEAEALLAEIDNPKEA